MKKKPLRIGVDLMGADIDPSLILHAIAELPKDTFKDTQFVLFGETRKTLHFAKEYDEEIKILPITFVACSEVITMNDDPVRAVKRKKDASLNRLIDSLANKEIDAALSCANTGALVLASYLKLKPVKNIEKPSLATLIPVANGHCVVLDVGATPECSEKDLVSFAKLGSGYARCMLEKEMPRVGILNIGQEAHKGSHVLNRANEMLSKKARTRFSFVGNVEPHEVFAGEVDVLLTSGFIGNVFLKTAEAVAMHLLKSVESKLSVQLEEIKSHFSQDSGQGGFLLGVNGYVCKCHGLSTVSAIQKTVLSLKTALQKKLLRFL